MMSDVYDFHMLAVEKDSTGYYHVRWDRATKLTVRATNRNEAYQKCWAVMGEAKRHDTWTAKIDRIEPVTCGCTKPGDQESGADHRKVLDAQQDKWMRESVRAERAEDERDRLLAAVERVEALADHWRNVEMPEAPVADEVLTAVLSGEEVTE